MSSEPTTPSIPRLVPSCDLRRLPLTPAQAFLLSRVDGFVSVQELSLMTGLSPDEVGTALQHLVSLGAVSLGEASKGTPCTEEPADNEIVEEALAGVRGPVVETYASALASPALYDPAELDEQVDIPPDKRRRVLDVYYRLDQLTHYELLGVETSADKKVIKDAYYRLASEYHPDRYFRKTLGSFKPKMEAVFARLTQAHDTLTKKQTRTEYDAYVQTQLANRTLEAKIRGDLKSSRPDETPVGAPTYSHPVPRGVVANPIILDRTAQEGATRAEINLGGFLGTGDRLIEEQSEAAPSSQPAPGSDSGGQPDRERIRREVLARRLRGGHPSRPPPRPQPSQPSVESAAMELKRLYAERQAQTRRTQVAGSVHAAQEATLRNDPAMAALSYREALKLAPDNPQLQEALEEVQQRASRSLAEGYLKQAAYEENAGRWKEAARSLMKAADVIRDNASVQNRAANAMLRGDMDLRLAAQYGARAVELAPRDVSYRATLAMVFMTAGHRLNARRELEIAAELAPGDANIAKLLKTVR